jgi:mono/diheme cytochrome c family protein
MPIAIQNRVLLGITFFVGMMLLLGWIAINEPARMEVFTQQWSGKSVEFGASIFQNNCATCHSMDGLGQTGRAPALKNPMLFLDKNPAADKKAEVDALNKDLDAVKAQIASIEENQKKVDDLTAKVATETDAAKKVTLQDDLTKAQNALKRAQDAKAENEKKVTDLTAKADKAQTELDAMVADGWDPARLPRLKEVGWGGTLKAYVANAVAAGRPLSGIYWPQIMPTWGQAYGGPMRPDEVENVTNYIMNWRDESLKLKPKDVRQQFADKSMLSGGGGGSPAAGVDAPKAEDLIFTKFGKSDTNDVTTLGDLSGGDATKGQALYSTYACAGCHNNAAQGPNTKGTWYRTLTQRIKEPANSALTGEQFLAQTILYPNAYVTSGYGTGVMPQNFGTLMDLTQLKDIIAYLKTQNTP